MVIPGQEGSGLVRPLERSSREAGVEFRLQHRLRRLLVDQGCVWGVEVERVDRHFVGTGEVGRLRARRAVILATGGATGNVTFRTMFDPRLTEEYGVVGQSWSLRHADGHLAGLAIGAALAGTAGQTNEASAQLSKGRLGVRDNYHRIGFPAESSAFFRAKATGHVIKDWSNAILVKSNGRRFWNEEADVRDYDYLAAAMAWSGTERSLNGGGPVWCILDALGLEREGIVPDAPVVDRDGYFFSADSIAELAPRLSQNSYQRCAVDPVALAETVAQYNRFVDQGRDPDFGKAGLRHRIETPPFYAGWHTPICHDTYVGLRTTPRCAVLDLAGAPIPGLYAAGECQGGFSQHGLGRAVVFGRIAGLEAGAPRR